LVLRFGTAAGDMDKFSKESDLLCLFFLFAAIAIAPIAIVWKPSRIIKNHSKYERSKAPPILAYLIA